MYLKSLTLRGFKSFASATALKFEPGITCVVGPNGSGKSNVVDALAWVMGEQGAKSLRGGKMEDVIFAGTSSRAPLGRAEVALTIDNSDGALPIDYTEVTISRLMFRQGSSEYAINGDSCRLLDIQELLSDSGIGREMHVIVGQGQLDTVLHAGPEERRALIEEAAGVLKHRKRKEKALRKLDAMQANLQRLTDLTTELRRQLKPLGRQAEIARRAAVIQADLRDAKLRLLADDLVTLRTELAREEADEAAVRERRALVENHLERAKLREAELEAAASAAAPVLTRAQQTWSELSSLRERLRGLADLAAERHRNLAAEVEVRHGREPDDMEREALQVRETEERLRAELETTGTMLSEAVDARAAAESALKAAERRIADAARAAADRREGLAKLRGQVDALRSRARAAEDEIGRLTVGVDEAARRAEDAEAEYTELRERTGESGVDTALTEAAEAAAAAVEAAEARHDAANTEVEAARARVTEARAAQQAAEREQAALTARKDALELSLSRTGEATEALLGAGHLGGVLGPVTGLLDVTPGAEAAVAAALGEVAEAVAVASVTSAADALDHLKSADAGRVTLVIRDDAAGSGAGARAPLPAGAAYATDLVRARDGLGAALAGLLADVVVVDDLAAARTIAAAGLGLRAVTRGGDLLGPRLAHGGSASAPGQLEMQAAVDEAAAGIAEVESRAAAAAGTLAEAAAAEQAARAAVGAAKEDVKRAQAGVKEADGRIRAAEAASAKQAQEVGRVGAAARAAREEEERLRQSVRRAEESRDRELTGLAELEERLAAAEVEPADDDEPDTSERDDLAETCVVHRQAEMDARLASRTAEERVTQISGRADALERSAAAERQARREATQRRERRRGQAAVAAAIIDGTRLALERVEASLHAAASQRDSAQEAAGAREAELKTVRTEVRDLTGELDKLVNVVHGGEVARAEQRLRLEQMETRAVEELGVDVEALVTEYGPDVLVPPGPEDPEDAQPSPYVRADQVKREKAAQRQLNQLGKVNPLALEEFAALEERHTFLSTQLEDLKKTRRDLLTVVKEVDERVEQVFTAAYADVAVEFERIFSRLFPGGDGRLVLTEPEDMLATGVEVEARPPGKKVKRLSLLSGGERSLTAIAYLVAIFRARPSPFYVLDEVEAALDDTNLQRLLLILEELRERSQLLVITHQKRTMEVADALYGISMRGDGVSGVISQRMSEHARS
ncbi:MAG TPA: chromosome segregation protein SMC [Streptosporangiaceae bacterium]